MSLVRWSPFGQAGLLQKRVNRPLDATLHGPPAESKDEAIRCNPAVGFHNSDNEVVVYVDLKGVDEPAVKAHVENNILTIQGEGRLQQRHDKESFGAAPRGRFTRSFMLATAVDPANVCARCKDGVLTITLPKATSDKTYRHK